MQNYTDFPYSGDPDSKLWSSFMEQSEGGVCDDYDASLYSWIFPTSTPPHHFSVTSNTTTLPLPPIVVDYSRRHSLDFAPFEVLIDRRNWCLSNLRLTAKEAEALRQENVNLQMAEDEFWLDHSEGEKEEKEETAHLCLMGKEVKYDESDDETADEI
ncbi:hypothetical protein L6452_32790 [Arctium lappa]|uniref:Uncharacterized protein n=1 Tax=Arctium lappa TaxID=4217 RepID=A0ACB8Z9X4_ARCLA|nr:hypothetical protein L6452_32790 [Arctium lappa]